MTLHRRGQEGLTVVALVIYVVGAGALYLAYLYAPMGWRHYQVREAIGHAANIGLQERDDTYVRVKCAEFLSRGPGIKARPDECDIHRERNGMAVTISFTYTETIRFFPTDKTENYTQTVSITSDNR